MCGRQMGMRWVGVPVTYGPRNANDEPLQNKEDYDQARVNASELLEYVDGAFANRSRELHERFARWTKQAKAESDLEDMGMSKIQRRAFMTATVQLREDLAQKQQMLSGLMKVSCNKPDGPKQKLSSEVTDLLDELNLGQLQSEF